MSPEAKESEGRKKSYNDQTGPRSRKVPMNGKKYLPSTAFSKTVKSSTTKSLLKFRERQEQQELKKAQQYKSYKRVMKREGYDIMKSTGSQHRKRPRDDNIEDSKVENSTNMAGETSTLECKAQADFIDSNLGIIEISPNDSNIQNSTTISMKAQENAKRCKDGTEIEHKKISECDDLHKKNIQSSKWTKKKNQQLAEQRRADEYKQRQIQVEREKKEKLKQRQERHRLLSSRTSRGQPIMKNIALDILNKLQREQQQQQQHQQQDVSFKHR
jgi:hypothetical protein